MTDSPTPAEPGPVDPDAELASTHLDGEAGAHERARVDDEAVQAHLRAFAGLPDAVRDVPPPPPDLLDAHVARAMEAFDADDRVVPLDRARRDGGPWWGRIPIGAVAAALFVVALVGAIGLAATGGEDGADTAATAVDTAGEGVGGGGEAADDSVAAGAMEESTASDATERFEGVGTPLYEGYDALAEDLRAELVAADEADAPAAESDVAAAPSADGETGTDPCGAVGVLGLDPAAVVLVRGAIVAGDEVTAVVHEAADGRRLTVVDDATCGVVLDRIL